MRRIIMTSLTFLTLFAMIFCFAQINRVTPQTGHDQLRKDEAIEVARGQAPEGSRAISGRNLHAVQANPARFDGGRMADTPPQRADNANSQQTDMIMARFSRFSLESPASRDSYIRCSTDGCETKRYFVDGMSSNEINAQMKEMQTDEFMRSIAPPGFSVSFQQFGWDKDHTGKYVFMTTAPD